MEELLANAFNTGDIKIVAVAAFLYLVIYLQRKDTSKKRNADINALTTRVALTELQLSKIDELELATRLASIETSLKYIQMLLEEKRENVKASQIINRSKD